jgi:hypothetical protein
MKDAPEACKSRAWQIAGREPERMLRQRLFVHTLADQPAIVIAVVDESVSVDVDEQLPAHFAALPERA